MDLAKLQRQLILHEGLKLFPYVDTVGKTSIGVGHDLTDVGLTTSQCLSILNDDIKDTTTWLDTHLPWWTTLDDVRARALVDLVFDIRAKVLSFTHMLTGLQTENWAQASDELMNSTFATQTGQRAKDLAHMFLTGVDL